MKNIFVIVFIAILFCGCAANVHHDVVLSDGVKVHGFWYGLWHGIISPITFIISLFSDNVTVWETHNNGGWYTFGFLIGIGTLHFGSSSNDSK